MNLPERFDLTYVAEDGTKKRPVMIHRALFGSLERFIGILIEHYAGAFPTWLAPVQVKLIPVNNEYHLDFVNKVKELLLKEKEVLNDEVIVNLIDENQLTNADLVANDSLLVSYLINKEKCLNCTGLKNCKQSQTGYLKELFYEDETFKTISTPCRFEEIALKEQEKAKYLKLVGIDYSLYTGELFTNSKRKDVLRMLL
mgnify:CR=1 FL=1